MDPLNVMIVDDSRLVTKIVVGSLVQLKHRVVAIAPTGAAAIAAYPTYMPDVVLMDITMPDMDGIAATEAIIKAYPDARIIIITSHGDENIIARAMKAGAKGFIRKPFSVEKLQRALEDVVKAELVPAKTQLTAIRRA